MKQAKKKSILLDSGEPVDGSATDVLLINLGTPKSTSRWHIIHYLREFLLDSRVIDLPYLLRWLLVHFIFLPFRSKKTQEAYQKIWQKDGSPLFLYSQLLNQKLSEQLAGKYRIHTAMRYGNPSLELIINKLQQLNSKKLLIIPLYPQYASSSSGSAIAKALQSLQSLNNIPEIKIINFFYQQPTFIKAYAEIIKQNLAEHDFDLILFSFHGLPEKHIDQTHCKKTICNRIEPCPSPRLSDNYYCYRSQCFETARLIGTELKLNNHQYQVSFQSRLGKLPWIKPYTDQILEELIKKNIRKLAVVCPSFVCDCLETLEEINIRAQEQWFQLGGESFIFIPSLNIHPTWTKGFSEQIKKWSL